MNALAACLSSLHCFGLVLVLKASHSAVITGLQTPGDDICRAVMIKIKLHPVIYLSSIHKNHFTAKYQAFFVNFSALLTSAVTHTEHLQHCSLICPAGVAAELVFPQRDMKWGDGMKQTDPQSFTWPPIPLRCTHLFSRLGLISLRLNWAIECTLDLVIILYLALFSLSFLPFVRFLTFPFHTIWKKIRIESIYTPHPHLPHHTLSHTHTLSSIFLSPMFMKEGLCL